jgi:2-oxoglutarate dehydrogenase E2 component (dihydrolipoamide succinyltransferase)
LSERVIELVPPLGESITEGSIAEWSKTEGDTINVDDVIAVVETDKVTVDIKSAYAGVMVKRIAEEIVIVGQPLYEIETDASLAPKATITENTAGSTPPAVEVVAIEEKASHASDHRVPMIKFLGKRSLIKKSEPVPIVSPAASRAPPAVVASSFNEIPMKPETGVDFFTLEKKAFFGRPMISEKEMAAIESGGADDLLY